MSASQEKKKRIQDSSASVVDKRAEKAASEKAARKKTRVTSIIVIAVVVVLLAAALYVNSGAARRNSTAITVGDMDYSVTDYNYYYYDSFYSYYNTVTTYYSSSASSMLPDTGMPLKSQIYDESTGETWADFFDSMAQESMQQVTALYTAAMAEGYTLSDEELADYEASMDEIRSSAETNGQSFDEYIQTYYGNAMNEKAFRKITKIQAIATSFSAYKEASFTYTDEELEAHYNENKDKFDEYTYRAFYINDVAVDESEYDSEEQIAEAKEVSHQQSLDQADVIIKNIKSEDDFAAAAMGYDATTYPDPESTLHTYSGEYVSTTYSEWVMSADRKPGDMTCIDVTSGCYVVYFISRNDNHYYTHSARIISYYPDTVDASAYEGGTADPEYITASSVAYQNIVSKANDFHSAWVANGASVEEFIEEYNNSSVLKNAEDGLYENIADDAFPTEVINWLNNPSRKDGDSDVIQCDTSCYVIRYEGMGTLYSNVVAKSDLQEQAYSEWNESLGTPECVTRFAFKLTK